MPKRYFWLKLQDGFFDDSMRIKRLRKMPGGDTYVIIYLKMQLKAIKNDGYLVYHGYEEDFATELAIDLSEDLDAVRVTLSYLLSRNLVETEDNINYFLPWAAANTGSETASAQRVRECRAKKALQSNNDVTEVKRLCSAEIDSELKLNLEKKGKKEKPETEKSSFQQSYQQETDFEAKREEALAKLGC